MVAFTSTFDSYADNALAKNGDQTCYNALVGFCRKIGEAIDVVPDAEVLSGISALLPALLALPNLLTPEQRILPSHGYVRHNLFICPNEAFSVLAAVWPAGVVSPIHDHKTWCVFGIYEGVIRETRYIQSAAGVVSTRDLMAGDVTHLPVDVPDIHCMHNATGEPAFSIHVYGGDADQIGPNVKNIYNSES